MTVSTAEPTYRCYAEGDPANGGFTTLGILHYVVVRDGQTTTLTHHGRHVGCGPSWKTPHPSAYGCLNHGYGGSGPADLARSILADYLGELPHPGLYQDFKRAFTARFPQGRGWLLDGFRVRVWLRMHADDPWLEEPERASLRDLLALSDRERAVRERLDAPQLDDDKDPGAWIRRDVERFGERYLDDGQDDELTDAVAAACEAES